MKDVMAGFIDIYAKLIIAVVSFIAPLIVYLLSVYSDGISIVQENATEKLNQIKIVLVNQISENDVITSGIIKSSTRALKVTELHSRKRNNLLSPQRQIYRIFLTLFTALFFIMIRMLSNDTQIVFYSNKLSFLFLVLSFAFFLSGIYILRQVAWVVIETKDAITKREKEKYMKSLPYH